MRGRSCGGCKIESFLGDVNSNLEAKVRGVLYLLIWL